MWYVYVLKSISDGKLYTGSTNDLKRRLWQHNQGYVGSTAPRIPFELESYIAVKTESRARALERYLKTGSGKSLLKRRIL